MFCQKCGGQHDVATVILVKLNEDSNNNDTAQLFCESCCRDNGLWCEEHGEMIVYYDSGEDEEENYVFPYALCMHCCLERVNNLSEKERSEKLLMIEQFLPPDLPEKLLGDIGTVGKLGRDSLLLLEIYKLMMVCGESFEEVLTSLMPGVGDVPRNN